MQTAGSIHDPKRFKFDSDQFYVKSAAEMERLFSHAPQVVSRTMQFAERCSLKMNKVDNPFPEFAVPLWHTLDSYFEEVCREGLQEAAGYLDPALAGSGPAAHYRFRIMRRGWSGRSIASSR